VAANRGPSKGVRHVPRAALHAIAGTVGRVRPALGRQARAALAMDTTDLTFDSAQDARRRFPDLPMTAASTVLAGMRLSATHAPPISEDIS
jgi:hypothetical protein